MNVVRKSIIALTVCAALMGAHSTSGTVSAISPLKSPVATPVPGCFAKELLEVKRDPAVASPTVGVLLEGTQVYLIGRSGAWTNLYGYSYNGYYYSYAQGWTKGKVACR